MKKKKKKLFKKIKPLQICFTRAWIQEKACLKKGMNFTVFIETKTTSWINFDKYEMRGEIYSVSQYIMELPWATQIGLEHVEKNLRTMNTTIPLTPLPQFNRSQIFNGLFKTFPNYFLTT